MVKICKEESFHARQGYSIMMSLVNGSDEQRALAQDALDRWWWPALMMFGPHDSESPHTEQSMAWKIKRITNDDLRQMFIDQTVPQAHYLGLTIPDPELEYDEESGHWSIGEINWDEFWATIKGDGLLNRERVAHKVKAWDDGRWVRDGAEAHAAKNNKRMLESA
jgi:ring-1,2-phenylacetyl-CoA epoxidase subunit PaaA